MAHINDLAFDPPKTLSDATLDSVPYRGRVGRDTHWAMMNGEAHALLDKASEFIAAEALRYGGGEEYAKRVAWLQGLADFAAEQRRCVSTGMAWRDLEEQLPVEPEGIGSATTNLHRLNDKFGSDMVVQLVKDRRAKNPTWSLTATLQMLVNECLPKEAQ